MNREEAYPADARSWTFKTTLTRKTTPSIDAKRQIRDEHDIHFNDLRASVVYTNRDPENGDEPYKLITVVEKPEAREDKQ